MTLNEGAEKLTTAGVEVVAVGEPKMKPVLSNNTAVITEVPVPPKKPAPLMVANAVVMLSTAEGVIVPTEKGTEYTAAEELGLAPDALVTCT